MTDQNPLAQRVASSFSLLSTIASDLNAVSDKLGKSVSEIDVALKKLNLGIAVWVKVAAWEGEQRQNDYAYWSEDLGYSKIGGKWGISLRRVDGNYRNPDEDEVEEWLFSDAPRALRIAAIDKIPELLDELGTFALKFTRELQNKMVDVQAVAAAVNPSVTNAAKLAAEESLIGTRKKRDLILPMDRAPLPQRPFTNRVANVGEGAKK